MRYRDIIRHLADGWEGDTSIEAAICDVYNCTSASVDAEGNTWIEGPQRGHWLDEVALSDLPLRLRAAGYMVPSEVIYQAGTLTQRWV